MKRLANTAFVYALIAMLCGVIYREGSKFLELTEPTTWSLTHSHFFVLGMFFFLIVLLLEKSFHMTKDKKFKIFYIIYNVGLIVIFDITKNTNMMYDKMISGISGIGHILLGMGIVLFFIILKKQLKDEKKKTTEQ